MERGEVTIEELKMCASPLLLIIWWYTFIISIAPACILPEEQIWTGIVLFSIALYLLAILVTVMTGLRGARVYLSIMLLLYVLLVFGFLVDSISYGINEVGITALDIAFGILLIILAILGIYTLILSDEAILYLEAQRKAKGQKKTKEEA
jgi:hypothetical protein